MSTTLGHSIYVTTEEMVSHDPIPGVSVEIKGPVTMSGTTDQQGRCVFDVGDNTGLYIVTATYNEASRNGSVNVTQSNPVEYLTLYF